MKKAATEIQVNEIEGIVKAGAEILTWLKDLIDSIEQESPISLELWRKREAWKGETLLEKHTYDFDSDPVEFANDIVEGAASFMDSLSLDEDEEIRYVLRHPLTGRSVEFGLIMVGNAEVPEANALEDEGAPQGMDPLMFLLRARERADVAREKRHDAIEQANIERMNKILEIAMSVLPPLVVQYIGKETSSVPDLTTEPSPVMTHLRELVDQFVASLTLEQIQAWNERLSPEQQSLVGSIYQTIVGATTPRVHVPPPPPGSGAAVQASPPEFSVRLHKNSPAS